VRAAVQIFAQKTTSSHHSLRNMQSFIERSLWPVVFGFVALACTGEISDANFGGVDLAPVTGAGGGSGQPPLVPRGGGGSTETTGTATGAGGAVNPGSGPPPSGTGGSTGAGSSAYCDLQQMLRARCVGCHSNPPVGGAPMPLVTYADLLAPARTNPSKTVAELAIERMQDPVKPMPPSPLPRATPAETSTVSNWIAAGTPVVCNSAPSVGTDAGSSGGSAGLGTDGGVRPPPGTGDSGVTIVPSDGGVATAFCDVQQLLRARCVSCHSNPPVGGAPMPLVTYANLMAPAPSNPSQTVAAMALARMQDGVKPMPPSPLPRASATEVNILSNWMAVGSPSTCLSPTGADAGAVTITPVAIPVVCTSGQRWTGGNAGSASMHPGGTCISCHTSGGGEDENEAPRFTIAGTVYPTVREPNDCNGVNGAGIQVVITDATGRVLTLPVNAVGNFSSTTAVTRPFHAKVVRGGVERTMTATQTSGDCNTCHTQNGANGAPGRIVVP
jgi:hypothetical protein